MDALFQIDHWRVRSLIEALAQYADIMQSIALIARDRGELPSNNALETDLWPIYRNRITRKSFRHLCDDVRRFCQHSPTGPNPTATDCDLQPLSDGNVLIEFFGDDGKTFNKQIVTPEMIRLLPLVAAMMDEAIKKRAVGCQGDNGEVKP